MNPKKTCIITGGSSGIGFALASLMLQRGYQVTISGRDKAKLEEAGKQLKGINENYFLFTGDVSNKEDCRKLVDETVAKFGGIDVLVNNAGISMRGTFEKTELTVLEKLMNINFWGAVFCTKFALPFLMASRGSIVGISSIAGKVGLPARTGYSASKFALEGFLESLRTETRETGLHVLTVCPGFTSSNIRHSALGPNGLPQGESPRSEKSMMGAEEVAMHIFHGIESRTREIVLTAEGKGAVLFKKFFPGWLEKMVFQKLKKEKNSPL